MDSAATALGDRFTLAGPGVIMKDFGDELVLANLDTGLFYSLSGSAISLWTWLSEGRSRRDIEAAFEGPAAPAAIAAFIGELVAEALLKPGADGPAAPAALPRRIFEHPVIERFDDLQGLLLVDPIHDVSEQGWPLRPNGT